MTAGKVILIGAGPGDEGLLTLKGKTWIERADTLVYDHLVNVNLTRFARKDAEIVYAGKKSGQATLSQEEINALLIQRARAGKTVARLKGGDPFIFGRGGEETQALRAAGIPFIVVPGVSSPIGVPAYAGIPLTHRDYSSTVSIITGSIGAGQARQDLDWAEIARRPGTLVFLMGARKLPLIAKSLMLYGRDPETPIAVIQWGTTPRQKTWRGTLRSIIDVARAEKIQPPALTIVGEVVNLKEQTDWFEAQPLFGKSVVVTRAEEQAGGLLEMLRERGAEALAFPVIKTAPPPDWAPLDAAVRRLKSYDGVIFTSVNGVKYFMERLLAGKRDIRDAKGPRLYAIGPKTAQALRELRLHVDVMPEEYVAEGLLAAMSRESVAGKRFLLPRAAVAREVLPDSLRALGAKVDVAPAYQTVPPESVDGQVLERLRRGGIDVITFTASSTVNHFMQLAGEAARPSLARATIACIGPVTADTARQHGLEPRVIPADYTVEALVAALDAHFTRAGRTGGG